MSDDPIGRLNTALEGRYHIERQLGEGGMATVYLADDLRHERKVALKVLKPELAAVVGAERFLAEIKTTANLQHPHILPLYDSGEAGTFLFYVMPYVQGETLRDRLDRERQLPVEEAVALARAASSALDFAHRHGVVHRDIKPANVLIQDGQPVLADFGIALAVGAAGGARLTETGLSLGTPYYMSPEQATGDQTLGPAADIYALGAVLYETLTGDPPYTGSTAQAVLGKIIRGGTVSAAEARPTIPRNVDGAIRKALERIPADRFTHANDFARALADPGFRYGEPEVVDAGAARRLWNPLSYGLVAAVVILVVALLWPASPTAPPNVVRVSAPFEEGERPVGGLTANRYALSPDGSLVAYRRQIGPNVSLWMRRWNELRATPIRDTDGAAWPTVSPDGTQLAFESQTGQIQVVSLEGGPARTLASGAAPFWGRDGNIYFATGEGLHRIPASGGSPQRMAEPPEDPGAVWVTDVLPDADIALVSVTPTGQPPTTSTTFAVDLETGQWRRVVDGWLARYTPTGHLVYVTEGGTLMGGHFDPSEATLVGGAVPIIDGAGVFALSDNGTLLYNFLPAGASELELVWVDRSGVARPVSAGWTFDPSPNTGNRSWRLSPDGTRIAVKKLTDLGPDIWIKPVSDGPESRLTFYEGEDRFARWSEDGTTVTFLSDRDGSMQVWRRRADGTGDAELVLDREVRGLNEGFWAPGGEWLLLRTGGVGGVTGGRDIYAMRPGLDTTLVPLATSEYDESAVAFSPDGRWMAYQSNETGRREVYVRPFPDVDRGKWQVSRETGRGPLWAHSGREVFYLTDDGGVMAATVDPGPPFAITEWKLLFEVGPEYYFANNTASWDIAPDDQRFLMARSTGSGTGTLRVFVLVLNLFEELEARVPR
jgi:serine/threonine-protein kinase